EGERNCVLFGQDPIAAIAIDLQDADEASEVSNRSLGLAIWSIDIGHSWRVGSAPRAIVARISEELPGLGPPLTWIEHRRRGPVGKELHRALQRGEQPLMNGAQQEGSATDPIG